jgi:hypothetical protein
MQVVMVVPPHTKTLWLKATARTLALKHPDVVVLGPVEARLLGQLVKHKVPMIEPPVVDKKPVGWWPRVKHWWSHRNTPVWNPWEACDVVLILWDHSEYAAKALRKAKVLGKKTWFIQLVDDGPSVEVPMRLHH